MPYVYDFDHEHPRPPMELKDLLGGKGANLAEMTSVLELPVPPGFTISTDACRAYMAGGWPKGLDAEVASARARLEAASDAVRLSVQGKEARCRTSTTSTTSTPARPWSSRISSAARAPTWPR